MKQCMALLMLALSITGNLFAQENKKDKTFDVPSDFTFGKDFSVNLSNSNKMRVELSDYNDLQSVANIDSILRVYVKDMEALKDSLSDPLNAKRVDYIIDKSGSKKIRLQQYAPKGSGFLLNNGELDALKTDQDTLIIMGTVINPVPPTQKLGKYHPRSFRYTFYLNNLSDLTNYMDGQLNAKIKTYEDNAHKKWKGYAGHYYPAADTTIIASNQFATNLKSTDYLNFNVSIGIQNYKSYFTPSFNIGMGLVLANKERKWKHVMGIGWEPMYFFNKDDKGNLKTYRNDFLTLYYGQAPVKDNDPGKQTSYTAIFSLGYVIHREGNYFEKGSFRLGGGRFEFHKTYIEPVIYFNNLFREVSPGLRIVQSF